MAYRCKSLITTEGDSSTQDKRLSICLGADGFSFSVMTVSGQLLTFGEVEGTHASSITDATRELKAFFSEVGIRSLGYKAVELIVISDESTWVPDELYSSVANRQYLRLLGSSAQSVMSCQVKSLGSTMVFSANDQLVMAFKVALPGVTVMNQHARMVQFLSRSTDHPLLVSHWRQGRVDLAAMNGGKYLYGNTLSFSNPDEALFQVVEVMKTFGLDTPDAELLLCGDIGRDMYARLRPYFPVTTLYNGSISGFGSPEFKRLHTYRHALILM